MAHAKKSYEDDDGRTIVDMSQVDRPAMLGFRRDLRPEQRPRERKESRPWEEEAPISHKERRMYALGALKAALLIGLAYLAGLALIIFLLIQLWN